jgi:hypothetical protein
MAGPPPESIGKAIRWVIRPSEFLANNSPEAHKHLPDAQLMAGMTHCFCNWRQRGSWKECVGAQAGLRWSTDRDVTI